jgi:hypothetical protein
VKKGIEEMKAKCAEVAKSEGFENYGILIFNAEKTRVFSNLRNNEDLAIFYVVLNTLVKDIEKKCFTEEAKRKHALCNPMTGCEGNHLPREGKHGHNRNN